MRIKLDHDWTNVTTGCLCIFHIYHTEKCQMPEFCLYSSPTGLQSMPQQGGKHVGIF